ncbi:MAG: hypothetical protein IJ629_00770 [Clostridia bacterium]|nr:hypothetical protein [Clostridia bacterium]
MKYSIEKSEYLKFCYSNAIIEVQLAFMTHSGDRYVKFQAFARKGEKMKKLSMALMIASCIFLVVMAGWGAGVITDDVMRVGIRIMGVVVILLGLMAIPALIKAMKDLIKR